jgi:hypothetical protein
LAGAITAYIASHANMPEAELNKFRLSCLECYQEMLDQIRTRFSFNRNELKYMSAIIPENVMRKKTQSLSLLALQFPNVISENQLNDLDREWRLLPNIDLGIDNDNYLIADFENFWNNVASSKNYLDEPMSPLILKLVNHITILPHSSATVERVFSIIN